MARQRRACVNGRANKSVESEVEVAAYLARASRVKTWVKDVIREPAFRNLSALAVVESGDASRAPFAAWQRQVVVSGEEAIL